MKVIDVVSGRGYYSDLLSRVAGPSCLVIAQNRPDVSRMAAVLEQRCGNNRLPNLKRDFIGAGFVFDGASDALRNPADDRKLGSRNAVAHQTDRAMLRLRKPGVRRAVET
ncbi:MAG: hypothetical protein ABIT61_09095 [Steroidobacteraceae bacterium]